MPTRFVEITSIIFLLGLISALHFLGDVAVFGPFILCICGIFFCPC